jgi:S1-C subfamily serine protease
MIAEVLPGGPAERDGLMKGDVLLKVGGKPVSGVDDLHRLLIADLAGAEQTVEILRAGRLLTRTVKPELDA